MENNNIQQPRVITMQEVVEGLKIIAENRNLSQEELQILLLEKGIDFSLEDVRNLMKQLVVRDVKLFEGMREGHIVAGASVICNMRDDEFGKDYGEDRFLSVDDNTSIYHFIRKVTGDKNYTKRNIEKGLIKSKVIK